MSTSRPSFAAANQVVTLTRVTTERVVNWVDSLQVSSAQFTCAVKIELSLLAVC